MRKLLLLAALIFMLSVAQAQNYPNVLTIGPLNLSPAPSYIYINTKIPFNDAPAPQLEIIGYNYGLSNKAIKFTLGWYHYQTGFYWSQVQSTPGYYTPSRIRLGTYDDGGTTRIRIEIANDGSYYSSFNISALDVNGSLLQYSNWSYGTGMFPGGTGNIHEVPQYPGVVYTQTGNLLVGKSSQTNPIYRLDVGGKVRANEVVVNTTGADYVFDDGYQLLPLDDLEKYVAEKKHLPSVPSAKSMQENGVETGVMISTLLSKIEELTLHLIDQNKKIKEQDERMRRQEEVLRRLFVDIKDK